jgi:hypothetical protein
MHPLLVSHSRADMELITEILPEISIIKAIPLIFTASGEAQQYLTASTRNKNSTWNTN